MRAMLLRRQGAPLEAGVIDRPEPGPGQIGLRVRACAVCRTDLHVCDGDLREPKLPLVPGHEIVGEIVALGAGVHGMRIGQRVGVPWLGWTCGVCADCRAGRENLCSEARFTGYHLDGGYAEYACADARYCFAIPDFYDDAHAAPLLCAGLIGYRALVKAGEGRSLGLYGFGAAAHIVAQVAKWQGRTVFAFTRPGDLATMQFARRQGCDWVGDSDQVPPRPLDAAIIFAPVGALVPAALRSVRKGGRVVCAGIHMSDIPSFAYELLWGEREIVSVANLTRKDGEDFLALAPQVPVRTDVEIFGLAQANQALERLRSGILNGAAVLIP